MINIKIDSRKIKKGDTFVALPGTTVDGHDYVAKAYELGAAKAIVEHKVDCPIEQEVVADTNRWLTDYVSEHYSKEVNEMTLIGVTGTNGKTTTAYLTYQILNKLGNKTGYIGTIGYYLPDKDFIELPNTTPNILDLYELLLEAKEDGCKTVMMEVSSHALHQERVKGLRYKTAAFTNLTQDHLDYHKTMEAYLEAKQLILKQLDGPMIVNADDPCANKWEAAYDNTLTFGKAGNDYKIIDYKDTDKGTFIKFSTPEKEYEVETNLRSTFNVYNYLTALSLINNIGYSIEEIIKVTPEIYPPKGRCEIIKVKDGEAVIDYAHTPDAVEKILKTAHEMTDKNIYTVFGCTGDRDRTKRPIMMDIVTNLSTKAIVTIDDLHNEDITQILDDMLKGIKNSNYEIELDRYKAIEKAISYLNSGDILLILGKGHEEFIIIKDKKIPHNDMKAVKEIINKILV